MKASNDINRHAELKYKAERARDEQILILSCCIDKLRLRIWEEEDADYKAQLINLQNMMFLCLANLERRD